MLTLNTILNIYLSVNMRTGALRWWSCWLILTVRWWSSPICLDWFYPARSADRVCTKT